MNNFVNQHFLSTEGSDISTEFTCNYDCNCHDGVYAPICGADGMSYLSPCHAGCKDTFSTTPGLVQVNAADLMLP